MVNFIEIFFTTFRVGDRFFLINNHRFMNGFTQEYLMKGMTKEREVAA